MDKGDMVECLINYYTDGNKARFSSLLGVKPQTVSAWIARNTFDAEVLYAKCEGLSAEWLLTNGEGEMLKPQQSAEIHQTLSETNEELIRLRAENDVLREVIGLRKKSTEERRAVG